MLWNLVLFYTAIPCGMIAGYYSLRTQQFQANKGLKPMDILKLHDSHPMIPGPLPSLNAARVPSFPFASLAKEKKCRGFVWADVSDFLFDDFMLCPNIGFFSFLTDIFLLWSVMDACTELSGPFFTWLPVVHPPYQPTLSLNYSLAVRCGTLPMPVLW